MVRIVAVSLTRPNASMTARSSPIGASVRARQRGVAAEDRLALALEAGAQRVRQGADAGDDHDAERHAGDEDVEAARPERSSRAAMPSSSGSRRLAAAWCR